MSQGTDIEEEYLTCYICYDVFTEPKTLACLHRFCEKCLQGYLLGQEDLARKKSFLCPVCREPCPSPNPRRPPSDWAGLLKTDFHLKNLIKALQADNAKRGRKVEVVHPCVSHADKEQDLYCVDCKQSICHLCAGISHRGCSQVITLTDAAHDRRATFDLQQRELSRRLLQVNQLREKIASAMEKITRQRSEAEGAIREASLATLTLVQRRETEQVGELAKRFESLRGAVAKRVVAMDRQISACEQVLETAAAKMASSSDVDLVKSLAGVLGEDTLDLDMETAEAFLTRLRNIRLEFVTAPAVNIKLGDVVVKVKGEEHSLRIDTSTSSAAKTTTATTSTTTHGARTTAVEASLVTTPSSSPQMNFSVAIRDFSTVSMSASAVHRNMLNSSHNTGGGHVHKGVNQGSNPPSSRYRPPVPPKRHRAQTFVTMETNVDGDPALLRTISSRFRDDELAPKLRDVLVVGSSADKVTLVTDWANQCVKAFYKRRERDSRLDVGGKPWCLAKVTDVQVAVSLPISQQICLLKVLPRLALQSSFLAQKRYSGLAALSPDVLVASGGSDPPCVDVINLGGEVLRSFSQDPSTSQALFAYPAYITMTPSKTKRFIVSDRRMSALISLDTSGHVAFHFQPDGSKSLREPSGVCTDAFGRVYIAESRGVVRLSPQGVLDRPLLKAENGVENPRGLDIDEEGLLYVTSRQEDILVFRVS